VASKLGTGIIEDTAEGEQLGVEYSLRFVGNV
jgi:hypothetical protein